jgi:hypothetical protein
MNPVELPPEKEILKKAAETIVSKPIKIKIDIVNPTFKEKILLKLKRIKPFREFEVRPLTYGKLMQITEILTSMDVEQFIGGDLQQACYSLLKDFKNNHAEILAIALTPGRKPCGKIKDYIIDNTTPQEGLKLCSIVLKQMDLSSFISSIVLMNGLKLLGTSQKTQGS